MNFFVQKTLCIWDSNENPKLDKECGVIFWSQTHDIDQESFSIIDILEANSDQLKSEYLEFIHDLGKSKIHGQSIINLLKIRDNLSFWWMTLLVEKSNWAKSPGISDIIKLMALNLLISKTDTKKILIKTDNLDLLCSLELLCRKLKIKIEVLSNNPKKSIFSGIGNFTMNLLYILKGIGWLVRETIFSIPFTLLVKGTWRLPNAKTIFVSYLSTVDVKDAKTAKFNNAFWGPLPSILTKKQIFTNWLYLPSRKFKFYETFRVFLTLRNQNNSYQDPVMISSFFNMNVLFKTLKDMFIVLKNFSKVKKELKERSDHLWPLIENDFSRSLLGSEMVSALFNLSLFEALENISSGKINVIYLLENQPWEVGLISSFKNKGRVLTGFAHSTIRYWDLRYFNDSKCYEGKGIDEKPIPNNLAVHGLNDASMMIKFGYPADMIKEVESLRYLYLNDVSLNCKKSNIEKKTLLVLGDFLKSNTMFMLSFLKSNEIQKLLEDMDVIVKSHPSCPIKVSDLDNINSKIENSDLGDLILRADVVFTGNVSSAAVEAYSLGKKIISVRSLEDLDMSPLRGVENVTFVSDVKCLKNSLKKAFSNNENQQNLKLFNLNSDIKFWKKILDF